ncbi:MAG: cysteine-rich small domain-containing protein [Turicibacter sp.]|nr:cysteine-rich small domain-containing protein [Turicibacter sp.]
MENNYKFFNNNKCEYFPCHEAEESEFNCLFCYCPLYLLGDRCGGAFKDTSGIKDCSDCLLPHIPEHYDTVVAKLTEEVFKV